MTRKERIVLASVLLVNLTLGLSLVRAADFSALLGRRTPEPLADVEDELVRELPSSELPVEPR